MLLKKLFRTAWKYKAQFLSMVIMVAIGVGIFVGFNMEWYTLQKDIGSFMAETEYADYRVYNEKGFSDADIAAVKGIDGVDEATRVLAVNVDVKDTNNSLGLFIAEDYVVSKMLVTSGAEYDENGKGFWLSDRYAEANGISVGDTLTITYRSFEISGEVVGLAKSSEYLICTADDDQLMPDYNSYGFVYASPKKLKQAMLGFTFYPQINIKSDMEKKEIEKAINAALGKTTLVLSKEEHTAYAGAKSEIEEGKTMAQILPVLFLAIGILTMVTTMHRIASNEKTQIGTLKALGFKDRKILAHYTSYGFVIGLIGAAVGIALGCGIGAMISTPNGMLGTYFDMPVWKLYAPWYCWVVVVATLALLTCISFLSVKKMLRGTAADALRPYTPRKMKPLKAEKTKTFQKLSFVTRWNLRDVFRHKSRSGMTLIGVIGCTILLVGGLGMQDTMANYLDMIDQTLYNYQTRVNIVEDADNADILSFAGQVSGDWLASQSVQLNGEAISLDIYNITHDKLRFMDKKEKTVELSDEGAYICVRLNDDGIEVGDEIEFSPYGSDETYTVKVAGVLRSVLTENIVMTEKYAQTLGIEYHISAVFTDEVQGDIPAVEFISGMQTKENLMTSYESFVEIMDLMVFLLVVAAVVLGIVVLYNLGVMSYVERYRELATLKVVGFKDKQIGKILISQNIWLTVVGVIIGLPAGAGVLYWLITALATEYELRMVISWSTYLIGIALTFGVSLVVGSIVSQKNKKINMTEALKGAE